LAEEVSHGKLEDKVGKARGGLARKETCQLGPFVAVGTGAVDVEELGEKGRNNKEGSIVCEEWFQEVGPAGYKVQA